VAKKAVKRSASKKAVIKATASPPRAASPGPSLGERAERLRDEILRSKLTHPDPWAYAAKARAWGDRAQVIVETIVVRGDSPATLRTLEVLHAEVEGDRDFQTARRLF
jgi:hypothetical protein